MTQNHKNPNPSKLQLRIVRCARIIALLHRKLRLGGVLGGMPSSSSYR